MPSSDPSLTDVQHSAINPVALAPSDCPLCQQPSLAILINNALYHKYLDSQFVIYLTYVDNIIDDEICPEAIKYKEMAVADDEEEFMRRLYGLEEYEYKNKAIVEYYKFHKDYPKTHIKGVSSIMDRFYERKKQFEYKKIKRILKEEQNISITTQKSSEIFSDIEEQDKKSHYSNVLNDLTENNSQLFNEETNQSLVWKNLCNKIDKAFQSKPLSPINFKKKSIFDQPQQKELTQTKNFVNYLKKQQEKKDKQEKYKNFIRSNKESRYNSIEQIQSKQYASGVPSDSNYIKKFAKKQKSKPLHSFKGPSAFYDGKMFYNGGSKGSLGSTKDQKTKQQSHTPSHDNFELEYHFAETGFKKNKEPYSNYGSSKRQEGETQQRDLNKNRADHHLDNFKSKTNLRTTEDIYKNATQEMKLKKRSISYNSLANTNVSSKRSSVNILALREKDFEIKNRVSSHGGKLLKQKNGLTNQINSRANFQNQTRLQRAKSSGNFRTSRSVPKFYQVETGLHSQNKTSQNSVKKISVPKDVVQNLKGKSYSASKLKAGQLKYSTESRQGSVHGEGQKSQGQKQIGKEKMKNINLFIENGLKKGKQIKDMFYSHQSSNAINIQKLLNTKLIGKGQGQKLRQPKILI